MLTSCKFPRSISLRRTSSSAHNSTFNNGAITLLEDKTVTSQQRILTTAVATTTLYLKIRLLMKLGARELIELYIYCWGHPLLYTFSGSVAVWMLLSGNLQQLSLPNITRSQAWRTPSGRACISSAGLVTLAMPANTVMRSPLCQRRKTSAGSSQRVIATSETIANTRMMQRSCSRVSLALMSLDKRRRAALRCTINS